MINERKIYIYLIDLQLIIDISHVKSKAMKNYQKFIDACLECLVTCEQCVTDCVATGNKDCILLCRDCADLCALTARFEARGSDFSQEIFSLCAEVCKECSVECAMHASHSVSCKECTIACKKCVTIFEELEKA